jgi:hypothetical protein
MKPALAIRIGHEKKRAASQKSRLRAPVPRISQGAASDADAMQG